MQVRYRGTVVDTANGEITFPTNTSTAELATNAIATVRATFTQLESHLDYDETPLVTFTYTIQRQESGSL